ncbi:MAG: hypothetical protein RPG89_10175 [Microcystis panniformis WG22]|nr:hypothetical protein [Microcystis panniformis WG22]
MIIIYWRRISCDQHLRRSLVFFRHFWGKENLSLFEIALYPPGEFCQETGRESDVVVDRVKDFCLRVDLGIADLALARSITR